MLKGIPKIISPELLMVLSKMGHGDKILLADGNFPADSMGKNAVVIRADGHGVPELLDAILKLMPLDTYVDQPVKIMQKVPGDPVPVPIWDEYKEIVAKYDSRGAEAFENVERFAFYDKVMDEAYAIIATGESAVYANIMIQKGVIANAE